MHTHTPVICLECGSVYDLVYGEGSVIQQTVCPRCGYAGWEVASGIAGLRSVPSRVLGLGSLLAPGG